MQESIYSQHIFVFPFFIDKKETNDSGSQYLDKVSEILNTSGWQKKEMNISNAYTKENIWNYNTFNYFHSHIRKLIFCGENKDNLISNFHLECDENSIMEVGVKLDEAEETKIALKIKDISLTFFESRLGTLSINLINHLEQNNCLPQVLLINDFARRLYPQFMGEPSDSRPDPITSPKYTFFPDTIKFKAGNISFSEPLDSKTFLQNNVRVGYIDEILKPLKNDFEITTAIDDRMFCLSWYGNDNFINTFKEFDEVKRSYNYENNKEWYKYVFTDGKYAGISNKNMMNQLIKDSTYGRHIEDGTLWGITRYSLVCITDTGWFGKNIVRNHLINMYYQIVLILQAQRATILKLSGEAAELSTKVKKLEKQKNKNEYSRLYDQLQELKASSIHFENHLWFEEVTPQEQGIEMYNMMRKSMQLEQQFTSLKRNIDDLNDYFTLKMQQSQDKTVLDLTIVATFFFILTLLIATWTFVSSLAPIFDFAELKNIAIVELFLGIILGAGMFYLSIKGIKELRRGEDDFGIRKVIGKHILYPVIILAASIFLIILFKVMV